MIRTGNNGISNIKLGNTQVNKIMMGTSGVWANKTKMDYTVNTELIFEGDQHAYNGRIWGLNTQINKSIDNTNYNYVDTFNYNYNVDSVSNLFINEDFNTQLNIQSTPLSTFIYKSDNYNKFRLMNNTLLYQYKNSSNQLSTQNVLIPDGYFTGKNVSTNSTLTGTLVDEVDLNLNFQMDQLGQPKISELTFYTNNAFFGIYNGGVYIILTSSIEITQGTKTLLSNSKFSYDHVLINLWATDSTGTVYDGQNAVEYNFSEFDNHYTFNSQTNVLTLTQYKYVMSTQYSPTDFGIEANIVPNGQFGDLHVSLDGTFSTGKVIDVIGEYETYFNGHTNYFTQFNAYNTEPEVIRLKKIKHTINYTLTDIFD